MPVVNNISAEVTLIVFAVIVSLVIICGILCCFNDSFIVTGDVLGHVKFFDQQLKLLNWYFSILLIWSLLLLHHFQSVGFTSYC